MKKLAIRVLLLLPFSFGCSDQTVPQQQDVRVGLSLQDATVLSDIYVLEASVASLIDSSLTPAERCLSITVEEYQEYCLCHPRCCETQRWYCPPNAANTIDATDVLLEICDDLMTPCQYGVDLNCPPPQIIFRSDCYTAHQCPPGSSGEFVEWFECQLEGGQTGRQRVLCNKGTLLHGPCQACEEEACDGLDNDCDNLIDEGRFECSNSCGEGWGFCIDGNIVDCSAPQPEEESCDYEDNDCDGEVDEGQRNDCDECGNVDPDVCDGIDNDCDNSIDEDLSQACETICDIGVEFCIEGSWIGCTARSPVEEACNGQDDDCDNLTDESLECNCSEEDIGVLTPCSEAPLLCGFGFKTCECEDPPECRTLRMSFCQSMCAYLPVAQDECDPTIGMPLPVELCNNFDDNCNQLIDEGLLRECYTGPPNTLNIGTCSAGEQLCVEGLWGGEIAEVWVQDFCPDEVLPALEVCDGADNDCDGEVDYGEEVRRTDILLIVDWSGSMDQEVGAVMNALSRFANQFSAEEAIHWGLIITPAERWVPGNGVKEHLIIVSDIHPFDDFFMRFTNIEFPVAGGSEQLLDALYGSVYNISANLQNDLSGSVWKECCLSVPEMDNFVINWRQDSDKIIVTFSDEEPFTYMEPENSEEIVQAALAATPELVLHTFSEPQYQNRWGRLAVATGGLFFQLTRNSEQMYSDLVSIVDQACLPRDLQ
jgi:hypothetical protein